MSLPAVSVIVPVKPGGDVGALKNLGEVTYPCHLLQILVVEGRRPSRQRNEAVTVASGEIVYFLDDDSLVQSDAIERVSRHFVDPLVAVVGGPSLTPSTDSLWQKTFGAALSSSFGGGGNRNRYRKTGTIRFTDESELILCNLAFRKEAFLRFGGLDERLYPNEENELMDRLSSSGLRCVHDPELAVFRSQRPSYKAFVRQMFTYGRGRGEQTLISRQLRFSCVVPLLFLLYALLLPLADNPVYSLPLLCYALIALCFAITSSWQHADMRMTPLLLIVYPTIHGCYGAGVAWGMMFPRFKRIGSSCDEIFIKDETMTVTGLRQLRRQHGE